MCLCAAHSQVREKSMAPPLSLSTSSSGESKAEDMLIFRRERVCLCCFVCVLFCVCCSLCVCCSVCVLSCVSVLFCVCVVLCVCCLVCLCCSVFEIGRASCRERV